MSVDNNQAIVNENVWFILHFSPHMNLFSLCSLKELLSCWYPFIWHTTMTWFMYRCPPFPVAAVIPSFFLPSLLNYSCLSVCRKGGGAEVTSVSDFDLDPYLLERVDCYNLHNLNCCRSKITSWPPPVLFSILTKRKQPATRRHLVTNSSPKLNLEERK